MGIFRRKYSNIYNLIFGIYKEKHSGQVYPYHADIISILSQDSGEYGDDGWYNTTPTERAARYRDDPKKKVLIYTLPRERRSKVI